MAWDWAGLGRAGQGLKRRSGATLVRSPIPCTRQCTSHDARIGGDPDTDVARRFRIGGSYKEKNKKVESAPKLSKRRDTINL